MSNRIVTVETDVLLDPANPQLLVHVATEDGSAGTGETWWGRYFPELPPGAPVAPIASMIDNILGPACLGASIDNVGEVETLWNRLIRMTYQYGDEGIVRTALSGIDIALWDLVAKREGVPVAALLGPTIHERIPVYASLHWLGNAEAIARDINRALDAGFEAIKLHESDPELIHAARAHIGPDVPLMIDASAAYDQVGAIDLAYAVADASLTWLEEPMYPQRDRGALARVRAAAPMPIAAGENEYSSEGFGELMSAEAVDVVQPEIAKFGGLTPARAIGEQIHRAGLQCCPHNYSLGPSWLASWHWASTDPATAWLEIPFLPEGDEFPLGMTMPAITNGAVDAPSEPGLAARATLNP